MEREDGGNQRTEKKAIGKIFYLDGFIPVSPTFPAAPVDFWLFLFLTIHRLSVRIYNM
jgi:hypothetical protein